ncbi:Lipopolysaccharide-assembly [Sphingobacterium nematocida]|uniref:Lipopolysaccharide-assembly n=1 Tax=Sphingobacterium nematocida TaxID=1513896 RepID=A0A1T5ESP5_9SPHI|nr:LptE family protein [Sphingobacterium nematocida]SKB86966.1 Lipopolysaccharide-assembly [Sphingobacterium nematocida]
MWKLIAQIRVIGVLLFTLLVIQSCGVKYSFTGGSIPKDMKTYTVLYFENIAPMVYTTLSQNFTEVLKERIRTQSSLSQVNSDGDAIFEGVITNYTITPASVAAGGLERAENSRLTITVKVKYTNRLDQTGESNFEESFSQFKEFPGSDVTSYEAQLNQDIIKALTEDIYNKAFANW